MTKSILFLLIFGWGSAFANPSLDPDLEDFHEARLTDAKFTDFFTPYHEKYDEEVNGFRVAIKAIVNGSKRSSPHNVVNFNDKVELQAQVTKSGRVQNLDRLDDRYELTFWWYKVMPADRAFQDPAALGDYSEAAQFLYRNYTPFIKKELEFTYQKFTKEYEGTIDADYYQSAVKDYASWNQNQHVGTLRWKVLVLFEDRETGESFYVTSPDERYLNGKFDKINYSHTRRVFLLARRGGTAHKKYNEALSYLGLPYIWWRRDVRLRLGSTCSQFVSYAATGSTQGTGRLFQRRGIKITEIVGGKFKGRVNGREVFLEYGKHVNPGQIIVYRHGLKYRHAAIIGDDFGAYEGFLDTDDMMIHGIIGGIFGGNFLKDGIEYVRLGKRYNKSKVTYTDESGKTHYIMKIVK